LFAAEEFFDRQENVARVALLVNFVAESQAGFTIEILAFAFSNTAAMSAAIASAQA
jgi:hypothetical protein